MHLKRTPQKKIPLRFRVVGIRAEESSKRASRPRICDLSKKMTHVKPIFWWKEYHVWDFIEKYKLKYPSLYDDGQGRIGCMICPFMYGSSKNAIEKIKKAKSEIKVLIINLKELFMNGGILKNIGINILIKHGKSL